MADEQRRVTYQTDRGERCIPFKGDLTQGRREMIVAAAIADGCADERGIRAQLDKMT